MLHPDKWPYTPEQLSELIEPETLAVITAGCCERVGRSLTVLDATILKTDPLRFDSFDPLRKFQGFCAYLRNPDNFVGGDAACKKCDVEVAQSALRSKSQDYDDRYRCHMGLQETRHLIKVQGHTVGVLLCGQWRPQEGIAHVQDRVQSIAAGRRDEIQPLHDKAIPELLQLANELPIEWVDFRSRVQKEVALIEQIAEANYQHKRRQWEENFLNTLRTLRSLDNCNNLREISDQTNEFLKKIQGFCRSRYVVFFVNQQPDETVLMPLANVGLPDWVQANLPHFNWRKANLRTNTTDQTTQILLDHATLSKGLRGGKQDYFGENCAAVAISLGKAYRAVILFGPFEERVDLTREKDFLSHMGRIISWSVHTEIQMLRLRDKKKEQENLSALITHQVRTAITPISTHIGTAKILSQAATNENGQRLTRNALKAAHELSMHLGTSVVETLRSAVLLQERDDMKFEPYPLSVLVENCAQGFAELAQQRQRQLVIHESIEYLPTAEVDIARLTIAVSNLIENALKYSYPNTRIFVRAAVHGDTSLDLKHAVLEVQNDGDEIPADKRERIFLLGERGLIGAKLQRIKGTGLGLWEARSVIENHGGKIDVRCDEANFYYRQQRAYRVVFTVTIPLKQQREQ